MANHRVRIELFRRSNPVIGVELVPLVINTQEELLEFEWYRKNFDKEIRCCKHEEEKADLFCVPCHNLKLPLITSYYCSASCYEDNWTEHKTLHSNHEAEYAFYYENDSNMDLGSAVKESDGSFWLKIGSLKNYIPKREDYGSLLKLVTCPIDRSIISTPIDPLYTDRVIERPISKIRGVIPVGCPATFKVLTYNILADSCLILGDFYDYCPKWAQSWEYRRTNLLQEIKAYDPDIICLQEVQDNHYYTFFSPELDSIGYSSTFGSERPPVATREGSVKHGCATFYRRSRFREVRHYKVPFRDYGQHFLKVLFPNMVDVPTKYVRLLQDNIALVSILEFVGDDVGRCESCYRLCVANTHISSHPTFKDVKLWQVATLLNGIKGLGCPDLPILICGDLNSLPNSAPYQLLELGCVHNMPDDPTSVLYHTDLYHGFHLENAYKFWKGESQFTYFTKKSSGTLDYIFYSGGKLWLKGLLELIERDDILKDTGLPSPFWSSDHVALMAEFCLMPQKQLYNQWQLFKMTGGA